MKPFPEPKSPEPNSVQAEKVIDLERKVQELSIKLLRSEKKNKEYEKLFNAQYSPSIMMLVIKRWIFVYY